MSSGDVTIDYDVNLPRRPPWSEEPEPVICINDDGSVTLKAIDVNTGRVIRLRFTNRKDLIVLFQSLRELLGGMYGREWEGDP